jgi:hypothetical protein
MGDKKVKELAATLDHITTQLDTLIGLVAEIARHQCGTDSEPETDG